MDKINVLLEIYKLHSDLADKTSQRRVLTNRYYITLVSAIATALAFLFKLTEIPKTSFLFIALGISIFSILICFAWITNLESYRQLNELKFEVLHELEEKLPFKFFKREWDLLKNENDKKSYKRLSKVEKNIPYLLMSPFIIIALYSGISLLSLIN